VTRAAAVLTILLAVPRAAAAQDQVVTVTGPVSPLFERQLPASGFDRQTAALTPTAARELIRTLAAHSDDAFIVHVVVWADALKKIKAQHWYAFDGVDRSNGTFRSADSRLKANRLFGRRRFKLLYVHIVQAPRPAAAPAQVGYVFTFKKRESPLLANLLTLASIAMPDTFLLVPETPESSIGFYRTADVATDVVPADMTVTLRVGADDDQKEMGRQTFVNEPRYYMNFSVAVPLTSYREVAFDSSNPSIVPNTIERQNIYAVADFYFRAVDLSDTAASWIPHAMFGVPIKSQPLDHLMLGGAIGLRWAEPFVGVVFDRATDPPSRHVVFGLNVPVQVIRKLLK
jgi:hypothetical protein